MESRSCNRSIMNHGVLKVTDNSRYQQPPNFFCLSNLPQVAFQDKDARCSFKVSHRSSFQIASSGSGFAGGLGAWLLGRQEKAAVESCPCRAPLQIAAGRPLSISPGLSQSAHRTSDDFVFN